MMLKAGLALAASVLVGCSATQAGVPPVDPPAATATTLAATPVPDPCAEAIRRGATFTQRFAERLADLRPLLLVAPFDAPKSLSLTRQISSLLQYDAELPRMLGACDTTVAEAAAALNAKAETRVAASLDAGFGERSQRKASRALFKLLPSVLSIADSIQGFAAEFHLDVPRPSIPDDTTAPLGPLPPLGS
jgi:hypothetical protein